MSSLRDFRRCSRNLNDRKRHSGPCRGGCGSNLWDGRGATSEAVNAYQAVKVVRGMKAKVVRKRELDGNEARPDRREGHARGLWPRTAAQTYVLGD